MVRLATRLGRHAPWIALVLCLPALAGGLALDDLYLVTATSDPVDFVRSAFTVIGDADRPAHFAGQDLSWWAAPGLQLDFFRPVAAATHAIDRALWPDQPWLMHAHSIAWFVLLTWLVRRVYRVFDDDPGRADLASFVFAVSQAHAMNVGWIAVRNSLVGVTFVVVTLLLHHRARSTRGWPWLGLSTVTFGVALLGNEGAVAGFGLLLAYALIDDRGPGRYGLLLPYVGVAIAWRALYRALGYGAVNSGMYLDPAAAPARYVVQAVQHGVIDLAGLLGLGVLDPVGSVPGGVSIAWVGALGMVVLLAWLAWACLRDGDTVVRWSALSMVLCLATAGTTLPTDRGLLLPSVAASLLIADLVLAFVRPEASLLRRLVGGLLVASHLVLSPLLLPVRVQATGWLQTIVDGAYDRLPDDDRSRHAVLLSAPSDLAMLYFRSIARHRDASFFPSLQWLYAGPGALTLTRADEHAIVLTSTMPWLAAPLDRGFRAEVDFTAGKRIDRPCLDATIEAVDEAGHPTSVRFDADPSCSIVWLAWLDGGPTVIELPAQGEARELPPATF